MERPCALITGATSGIGKAAAVALVVRGWTVLVHGRTDEKCRSAVTEIMHEVETASSGRVTDSLQQPIGISADLSHLASVCLLAEKVKQCCSRLDGLVNNAGVFTSRRVVSADGLEMQFAVNHLAGYALTRLLVGVLCASTDARVVMVSSGSHRSGRIHWSNLQMRGIYLGFLAYAQSKLANVLFARELQRRIPADSPVSVFAMEPGLVNTEMGEKSSSRLVSVVWARRKTHGVEPTVAARTIVHLLCDPEVGKLGGTYWAECRQAQASERAGQREVALRLWNVSADLSGLPREL